MSEHQHAKEIAEEHLKLYEEAYRAGYRQGFEDARTAALRAIEDWKPKP